MPNATKPDALAAFVNIGPGILNALQGGPTDKGSLWKEYRLACADLEAERSAHAWKIAKVRALVNAGLDKVQGFNVDLSAFADALVILEGGD